MSIARILPVLPFCLLAACTRWTPPPQVPVSFPPPPIEPAPEFNPIPPPTQSAPVPAVPHGEITPGHGEPAAERPPVTASPAVLALLDEARADAAGGNLDNAADSLERAIRIQPYHPLLWQQLAEIRLRQGQPGLAEELARKSSRHAGGNEEILRKNQAIIGEARRLLGTPDVPAEP